VQVVRVTTVQAARLFWMNIQSWKHQPFIQQHYSSEEIDRLEEDLGVLTRMAEGKTDDITWGMRQLALLAMGQSTAAV
jgi:hypothetical protein